MRKKLIFRLAKTVSVRGKTTQNPSLYISKTRLIRSISVIGHMMFYGMRTLAYYIAEV